MATQREAEQALFDAIEKQAKAAGGGSNYATASVALRELAYAWRALVGGTQPGASVVVKD